MEHHGKTVWVVDDVEFNRAILTEILSDDYNIFEFESGSDVLDYIDRLGGDRSAIDDAPDAVLLDFMMPGLDGLETLEKLRRREGFQVVPVLFITSEGGDFEARGLKAGASDYINKPFNPEVVKARVDAQTSLFAFKESMDALVADSARKLMETHERTLETLLNIIEYRSLESGGHIARTREYTRVLVGALTENPKFRSELMNLGPELIVKASVMHDVGKIGVPDDVLLKPGRLTNEEFGIIKKHSEIGADIVKSMGMDDSLYLRHCYDICRHHHERWDGTGYPDRLKGEETPLSARIVALVDVYDALVSTRVYKPEYTLDETYAVIRSAVGTQFQPEIVTAMFNAHAQFERVAMKMGRGGNA